MTMPYTHIPPRLASRPAAATALLFATVLTACAGLGAPVVGPGDTATTVRQRLGAPTAEHALPDGGRRLEYSGGSFGTKTFMVDTNAQGGVLKAENVRDEAHFNRVQAGITRDQLLAQIGTPSREWGTRYRNQTVWSYRFETPFCQEFQVGLSPQGVVEGTSYGPDPLCEEKDRFGLRN